MLSEKNALSGQGAISHWWATGRAWRPPRPLLRVGVLLALLLAMLGGLMQWTVLSSAIGLAAAASIAAWAYQRCLHPGEVSRRCARLLLVLSLSFVMTNLLWLGHSAAWWPASWSFEDIYWGLSVSRALLLLGWGIYHWGVVTEWLRNIGYNRDLSLLATSLACVLAIVFSDDIGRAMRDSAWKSVYLGSISAGLLWWLLALCKRGLQQRLRGEVVGVICALAWLFAYAQMPFYHSVFASDVALELSVLERWQLGLLAIGVLFVLYGCAYSPAPGTAHALPSESQALLRTGLFVGAVMLPPMVALVSWVSDHRLDLHIVLGAMLVCISALAVRAFNLFLHLQTAKRWLARRAEYDSVTGLFNHYGFRQQLSARMGTPCILIYLDICDFKSINEWYGDETGDRVLQWLAKLLHKQHPGALMARLGADHFALCLPANDYHFEHSVEHLQRLVSGWQPVAERSVLLEVKLGAVRQPALNELAQQYASEALRAAKRSAQSVVLHGMSQCHLAMHRQPLREHLNVLLSESRLPLHFQPIVDLKTQKVVSAEVLARLPAPHNEGVILPEQFMQVVNQDGKQLQLTAAVISSLPPQSNLRQLDHLNINLSPMLLGAERHCAYLQRLLQARGYDQRHVVFELTEESTWSQAALPEGLRYLMSQGFRFAIDDYGAGYSSASRLASLPASYVKLDRSLLEAAEAGNEAPLEMSLALAHKMGAETVVEGLSNASSLEMIRRLGGQYVQGYWFSEPLPLVAFQALLAASPTAL